jgi:hypothetical protein
MIDQPTFTHRHDQGMALFMAVFILTLVSMVALAGIQNSENEATASGRSRSSLRMLHAADAGLQYAAARDSHLEIGSFSLDLGDGRTVQSRRRDQVGAQPLSDAGVGEPPEGYAVCTGSGVCYVTRLYLVNVTATSNAGSVIELESKLGILSAGETY